MVKRLVTALVACLLLLAAGSAAWAADVPLPGQDRWINLVEALGLTDQQAEKMRQLNEEHFKSQNVKRNQIQELMFQLRQLSFERNPDMNKVRALQDQIFKLRSEMRDNAFKHRTEMRSILTPDQQVKWDSMRGQRMSRGQWRFAPSVKP
ncbi:MAG: Spy/CpxP family protein refolding chaperone [Bacillota bacterium]